MRVLLLNSRLSDRGGADRWLLGTLARLQERIETLLAVGYVDAATPEGEVRRVGRWTRIKGLDQRGLGGSPNGAATRLERLIDSFRPDVVHANDVTDPALLEIVAACGRGIQTVQDHRFFCPGRGKVDAFDQLCTDPMGDSCRRCFDDDAYARDVLALTRRRLAALTRMNRLTVLSHYMAEELAAAGVSPRRIVRIPPFADALISTAGASAGDFHLLASRLSAHKGIHVALAAARALRTELPLVVAGDGPLADVVRREARSPDSPVQFRGWVERSELIALLGRARSLWLPSLWAEPFGIAGLEALALGVPVIASDAGGIPEWLSDGENGLLVPPGSPAALADAADRLASDPQLATRLGRAGRAHVARHFAPEAAMRRLLEVYDEAGC